jgi:hypothetical protein
MLGTERDKEMGEMEHWYLTDEKQIFTADFPVTIRIL